MDCAERQHEIADKRFT